MERPIRLGISLHPEHTTTEALLAGAVDAEERGADVVFTWDHFFPLNGDRDGAHFECWTLLAAMAQATDRVELGPLVACNSYRNPSLHADMARTIDHIAGGRVIFGIGSGWAQRDYDEYGYPFGTPGSRLRDLARDLPIIKDRLERLNPPPLRRMPVMVGGGGEKVTLRITAEHADIWHGFGDGETIEHKAAVLAEHCRAVGRDVGEIELSAGVPATMNDDTGRGDELVAAGVTLLTLTSKGSPEHDVSFLDRWVEWRDDLNAN